MIEEMTSKEFTERIVGVSTGKTDEEWQQLFLKFTEKWGLELNLREREILKVGYARALIDVLEVFPNPIQIILE